jgi:hypothetical protein
MARLACSIIRDGHMITTDPTEAIVIVCTKFKICIIYCIVEDTFLPKTTSVVCSCRPDNSRGPTTNCKTDGRTKDLPPRMKEEALLRPST